MGNLLLSGLCSAFLPATIGKGTGEGKLVELLIPPFLFSQIPLAS